MEWALAAMPKMEFERLTKSLRKLSSRQGNFEFRSVSFKGAWNKRPSAVAALVRYWNRVRTHAGPDHETYLPGFDLLFQDAIARINKSDNLYEVLYSPNLDAGTDAGKAAMLREGIQRLQSHASPRLTLSDYILCGFSDSGSVVEFLDIFAASADLLDGKRSIETTETPETPAKPSNPSISVSNSTDSLKTSITSNTSVSPALPEQGEGEDEVGAGAGDDRSIAQSAGKEVSDIEAELKAKVEVEVEAESHSRTNASPSPSPSSSPSSSPLSEKLAKLEAKFNGGLGKRFEATVDDAASKTQAAQGSDAARTLKSSAAAESARSTQRANPASGSGAETGSGSGSGTTSASPSASSPAPSPVMGGVSDASESQSEKEGKALRSEKAKCAEYVPAVGQARRVFASPRRFVVTHPLKAGAARYLGYVRLLNGFWNFHPIAIWAVDRFVPMEMNEAVQEFPRFGALNLQIPNEQGRNRWNMPDGSLYIAEISTADLMLNNNEAFKYQVSFDALKRAGQFFPAFQLGIHHVVKPIEAVIGNPDFSKPIFVSFSHGLGAEPKIDLKKAPINVLLSAGDLFYGPLPLRQTKENPPRIYIDRPQGTKLASRGLVTALAQNSGACIEGKQFNSDPSGPVYAPICCAQTALLEAIDADFLSDEALLKNLTRSDADIDPDAIEAALRSVPSSGNSDSTDIRSEAENIANARKVRFQLSLDRKNLSRQMLDGLADFIYGRLFAEDRSAFSALLERVGKDPEWSRTAAQSSELAGEFGRLRDRIAEARREETKEIDRLAELRNQASAAQAHCDKLCKELEEKLEAYKDLGLSAEALLDRKTILDENAKLMAEAERIGKLKEAYLERIASAQEEASKLQEFLGEEIIPQALTDAFGRLKARTDEEALAASVKAANERKYSGPTGSALAKSLVKAIQQVRDYDENTVLNLYLTLAQNFLTVFSGEPGSGKTSICSILGRTLGLNALGAGNSAKRYVLVPVEYGWTTKRDFIGFHNPLTGRFESPDPDRWRLIRQLDAEARTAEGSRYPAVMVLDEANLSPMEYYWSDWMRLCDAHEGNAVVSLADGVKSFIPPTLRFLATVNNDNTTEVLSPRLIDRAAIVTLPAPAAQSANLLQTVEEGEPVSWAAFAEVFAPSKVLNASVVNASLAPIYADFEKAGIRTSARSKLQILRYVDAACGLFTGDSKREAADFAVMQKLLPRISGTGAAYRLKLEELLEALKATKLNRSSAMLEGIIVRGDEAMDCFRFF